MLIFMLAAYCVLLLGCLVILCILMCLMAARLVAC